MKAAKKKRLEQSGWRVAQVDEFLGLTAEEVEFIEMKLALSRLLKKIRTRKKMTQVQVAEMTVSSQSRVAKMEAADASVSIDLLIKSLLAVGATRKEVAKTLAA